MTLQSGHPFTALVSRDNSNTLGTVDRPNIVGDPYTPGPVAANPACVAPSKLETTAAWINPCAFVLAPAGTFGNGGRNNIIGPSFKNLDVVVSRVFKIRERLALQARGEFTNAFNLVNLSNPTATFGSALFGQIHSAAAMRQVQVGLRLTF